MQDTEYEPQHAEWRVVGQSPDFILTQEGSAPPPGKENRGGRCQIHSVDHSDRTPGELVLDTDNWGIACGVFVRLCVEGETQRLTWAACLPSFGMNPVVAA